MAYLQLFFAILSTVSAAQQLYTDIPTTSTQHPLEGPCDDFIIENFAGGRFNVFTKACDGGEGLRLASYGSSNDSMAIPRPPNFTSDYYATAKTNSCQVTGKLHLVRTGATIVIGAYKRPGGDSPRCNFNFYTRSGTELIRSRPLIIEESMWIETYIPWDLPHNIMTFEIDCIPHDNPVFSIGYVNVTNRCPTNK